MKEGIHTDIPIDLYHQDKLYFSATRLKYARKSLKLFKMWLDGKFEQEYKPCFDFGNAFELALLNPTEFDNKVAVEDEIYNEIFISNPACVSPRATAKYKEWRAEQHEKGRYIVPADGDYSFTTIQAMLESCMQDAVINKLIQNIEYNYTIVWTDKETGLKMKTRPDICKSKKNIVVNLKTTLDGSPEKFSRDLANFDYPFQACVEIDGVIQSGFMPQVDNYFWLVVEKTPPYSATLYEFSMEDRAWCMDEYRYVLGIVKRAMDENLFPSYSQRADNKHGILTASIPLWYRSK